MKSIKLILLSALILPGLMQSFGQGLNDPISYQDFSKSPMTLSELSAITKIQLAGEYWYYDAQRWKKSYDFQFIKTGKAELRLMESLSREKILETKVEETKPSLFQQPYMIVGYVIIAFATGIFLGLGG